MTPRRLGAIGGSRQGRRERIELESGRSRRRRLAVLGAGVAAALGLTAPASAAPGLMVGLVNDSDIFAQPDKDGAFRALSDAGAEVVRVTLAWNRVASTRPVRAADPQDPAYDWSEYDAIVSAADRHGIRLLFTVTATPRWANESGDPRRVPTRMADLRGFAYAAARRYSGTYFPRPSALPLPKVDMWTAWNEPNLRMFFRPQWKKAGGRWIAVSPRIYARVCNAVWQGVHRAGDEAGTAETVACGVTAPRGADRPWGKSKSVSPLRFLRGMAAAGAVFDVYAHHPYSAGAGPAWLPYDDRWIALGNIHRLVATLTELYGRDVPIWLTEYGFKTNPPDVKGVSWLDQAAFLRQAHSFVRRHPRIDMLVWYQFRDTWPDGWTSGLVTREGTHKPAYFAFRDLPR